MAADKQSIVTIARKRYDEAKEFWAESRRLSKQAIAFSFGDTFNGNQYLDMYGRTYDQARREREGLLTINITDPACKKIVNSVRMNRPQAKVMPGDSAADQSAAEVVEKWSRAVKSKSNADDATDTAVDFQVRGGEGYYEICLDYDSPDSFDKTVQIKPIKNPLDSIFLDPMSIHSVDGSSAKWGFMKEEARKDTVELEYGVDPTSWENDGTWVMKDTCIIAKYYYCDTVKDKLQQYADGGTGYKSENEGRELAIGDDGKPMERTTYREEWHYCVLLGGEDEPVHKEPWAGGFVPFCPVWGQMYIENGVPYLKGEAHNIIDQNRVINYMASKGVESIAKQESPNWSVAVEAVPVVDASKDTWRMMADGRNPLVLYHNAYTDDGRALPPPRKEQPAMTPTAEFTAMQTFLEFAHNASGQFSAPGEVAPGASGKAMNARQAQADLSTFHYPDNLARALRYGEQILINLFKAVAKDGDILRLQNVDGTEEKAQVNPTMEQPYAEAANKQNALGVKHIINPDMLGKLDVVISIGPSYQTQRQENSEKLLDMASKDPQMQQMYKDLIFKEMGLQDEQAWIARAKKLLPPELQDQEEGGEDQQKAQAQQQIQEMQNALQGAEQHTQEMQAALQGAEQHLKELEQQNQDLQMKAAQSEAKAITATIQAKRQELSMLETKQQTGKEAESPGEDSTESGEEDMDPQMDEVIFKLEEQTRLLAQGQEAIALSLAKPKTTRIVGGKNADGIYEFTKIEG